MRESGDFVSRFFEKWADFLKGRTAEEDGQSVVEELGCLRVDDVAALQFPCFRGELTGCYFVNAVTFADRFVCASGAAFVFVLVDVRCCSS